MKNSFSFIEPMMALRVGELPAGDWIYEMKFDGYRALAFRADSEVRLLSRNRTIKAAMDRCFFDVQSGYWALVSVHALSPLGIHIELPNLYVGADQMSKARDIVGRQTHIFSHVL